MSIDHATFDTWVSVRSLAVAAETAPTGILTLVGVVHVTFSVTGRITASLANLTTALKAYSTAGYKCVVTTSEILHVDRASVSSCTDRQHEAHRRTTLWSTITENFGDV